MEITCNVRYDGSHFVATECPGKRVETELTYGDWIRNLYRPKAAVNKGLLKAAETICASSNVTALKTKEEKVNYVTFELAKVYPVDQCLMAAEQTVDRYFKNRKARERRIKNKSRLTAWNYFTTLTYDDEKMSEAVFEKTLKKTLANFSTRRKWRYIGVWERGGEGDRLHMHLLLHVPEGEMVESCALVDRYSKKKKRMVKVNENSFFAKTFGYNDFKPIDPIALKDGSTIDYILKYIEKSDKPLFYSRNLPEFVQVTVNVEEDVVCTTHLFYHDVHVLFDSILDKPEMVEIKHQFALQDKWCFGNGTQATA